MAAMYIQNLRTGSETLPGIAFNNDSPSKNGASRAAERIIGFLIILSDDVSNVQGHRDCYMAKA
jgi:hypothetical protein